MHKYWGKKPPEELKGLIQEFSKEGDVLLDPFSGYGVFIGEAYINKRNVVSNDLNPVATFIQNQLLKSDIDLAKFENIANEIIVKVQKTNLFWNTIDCPRCNKKALILTTLRTKNDLPLKCKIQCSCSKTAIEHTLTQNQIDEIQEKEFNTILSPHPNTKILQNGRISAYAGLTTDDLFTNRALSSHIALFDEIMSIEEKSYRELLLLAFTSNLANCSKLVPPIKSRGDMAPGAWMTGFYVGDTYLENNAFHYFQNRVSKVIAGKKDFLKALNTSKTISYIGKVNQLTNLPSTGIGYVLDSYDTKKLPYPDNSIDYIFTDPPYGDSVPYFEQSVIWNTWLGFSVDYENEVVVSDSKARTKTVKEFGDDIEQCINEIYRVLKPEKYFTLTFHSISGEEWYSIINACLKNNFQLYRVEWLVQKTFTPRQLNRTKTVKGDMIITFMKSSSKTNHQILSYKDTESLIIQIAADLIKNFLAVDTNTIYVNLLNEFFSKHLIIAKINIIEVLTKNFAISEEGFWSK